MLQHVNISVQPNEVLAVVRPFSVSVSSLINEHDY